MNTQEIYEELRKIVKEGKGDYAFVNYRGLTKETANTVLVDDEKQEVGII